MKKFYFVILNLLFFSTIGFTQTITMSNTTQTAVCSGTYYDPGGTGNYSNNQNFTQTFIPSAGSRMQIVFSSFNTESGFDFLYVYNGNSASAALIGKYSGTQIAAGQTFISTATDGSLTFKFTSDGSTVRAGWAATVSCVAVPYRDLFISADYGSSIWCAGETRTITVTYKNTGSSTWTNTNPDINIGARWDADADYYVRTDANDLLPGETRSYNLTITAPAAGTNHLRFDVVKEGACWFRDNTSGCSGPGNVETTTSAITISGPTANAGSALAAICQGGVSAALGGSVGGSATGGTWSDGGVGGTFNPSATTLNATWTPPSTYTGTATLTLTTSGGSCGTATASKNELVNSRPIPTFTASPSGTICSNTNVTYTTQTGQSSYVWTYSGTSGTDYTIVSGAGTASVTLKWLTAGSKTVTVNYSSNGCNGATSASTTNTVSLRPVPTFTAAPGSPICSSTNVTYTTQPGQSNYVWTLPAGYTITSGGIGSTDNTVTLQWTTAGSKTVTVNYNNADGCNGSAVATSITTVNLRPTPTFTLVPSSPLCNNTNATYTTQSGQSNYVWNVPGVSGTDYTIISGGIGSTNNTVTLQWLTAGSKTVTVNYNTSSCSGLTPASSTITVNLRPVPTFTSSAAANTCTATNVTYTTQSGQSNYVWTLPVGYTIISGGISSTDNTVTLQWNTSGTKTVTVNYNNSDGCNGTSAASSATTVSARPTPTFTGAPGTNMCAYTNVTYTTQSGQSSYIWNYTGASGTDYNIVSGGTASDYTVTLQWLTAGGKTVSVNYTNANNCAATTSVSNTTNVNLRPVPTFTASPSGDICAGTAVTYTTESGQSSYVWTYSGAAGTDYTIISGGTGSSASVTLKWLSPGSKTVTVNYNTNGCNAITATSVSNMVNARPNATITSSNTSICNPGSASITGTVTANGAWTLTLSDGSTATGIGNGSFNITVNPTITTTYSMTSLIDANCSSTLADFSGSTIVTVNEPVVITAQPDASQITCATFPVDFIVNATGTGLTYQWYKNGSPLNDDVNISGSTTAHLNIDQAGMSDAGTYHVIVSGLSPCGSVPSDNSVLSINQEIFITAQPVSDTLCAGSTATFTVSATGTGIMYQWRKGTVPLSDGGNISGTNTAILTITNITSADAANNYNVVLTSPGGACPQANSANVKLKVNPIPDVTAAPSSQTICSGTGTSIALTGNVSGTTYSWTVSQTGVSGATAGSGSSIAQTLTATGNVAGTAVYTITPSANGCTGSPITVTITVNPTANVIATPSSQTICSGTATSIALTGNVSGTTYSWTVSQTGVSGATAGSGSSIAQTLTATGNVAGTAVYTVTPSANGCPGTPITVTITVNPAPNVTATPSSQTICSGTATSIVLTGNVSGTTYSWTVVQTGVSGASASSGASIVQTLTATGNVAGTAVYTVTPSANGCPGTPITVTITVNPTPNVTATPSSQTICSGTATLIALTGNVSGTTYSWTVAQTGVSGASASSGSSIAQTLTATGAVAGTAVYTVTPSANGCPGTSITVTITVNPLVTISPLAQEMCNGASITPIAISGAVAGTITSWTRDNPSGITSSIAASGSGPISGTFNNTNTSATTITFTINAQASNGCIVTKTATVVVDATLTAPVISASQILCVGSSPAPLTSSITGGSTSGYTYQWQRSVDGTANWTNVGTNTSTYTPSSGSYYYRLTITNGCGTVISNSVQISTANDFGLSFSGDDPPTTLCSGSSFTFTETSGSILGSLGGGKYIRYSWQSQEAGYFTSPTTNPYGASHTFLFFTYYDGTATFTVHNNTNAPVTKNLLITPNIYNSDGTIYCNLSPEIITLTINPVPLIFNYTATVCSGSGFSVTPANGVPTSATVVPANTKYSWSAPSVTGISGLAAGSTQSSISGTLTNNTNAPINVVYTVTPTYTAATSCPGTSTFTVTVTVNPSPKIPNQTATICSGSSFNITPVNAAPTTIVPSGTTYSWSAPTGTGFTGGSAGSGSSVSGTLTNTTNAAVTAIYIVTPTSGAAGTCPGANFTVTVTINPTLTAGIVSGTSPLCIGQTVTYTTTGNTGGTWSSSNPAIATVNATSGVVTGMSAGTANITYSFNSGCGAPVSALQSVTINPNVVSGVISGSAAICIGNTTPYTSNGTAGGTWSSSNTAVATVNAATGVVTGVSAGTVNILYTVIGCNAPAPASKSLTVNPNANPGIVAGTSPLCIGATATFTSNGDAGGVWSSSNIAVATVDASGVVTAVSAGTSNITYTVNSGCNSPLFAFKTVTVSPNANAGTISGPATICGSSGAQVQFSSIGGDAGGTWSSSNPSVATVTISGVVKAVGVGVSTITYTVNTGCNAPASSSQQIQVLNPAPASDPGAISGLVNVCASSAGFIYSVSPVANATSYVWTVPTGWTITSGATTNSITVTTGTTSGIITVKAANTCGFSAASSLNVNTTAIGKWIGVTSNWNDAQNWCSGILPDATMNVTIPVMGAGFYYPIISTATATVHNITIASGASITVTGNKLQIAGTINNSGTFDVTGGTIEMIGNTAQTISANTFMNNDIKNLIISNTSATGVTLGGPLNLYGILSFGNNNNQKLNSAGRLNLRSTATSTAMVADISNNGVNTGNKISGDVIVERYYPARRAWRLLTAPVSSNRSIFNSWQVGGGQTTNSTAPNNNGTYITSFTPGPGLDYSRNYSLDSFDVATGKLVGINNTIATKISDSATNPGINPDNRGYFMFVRGDRTPSNIDPNPTHTNITTLRDTGALQTYTKTFSRNLTSANLYMLIGNPYASPVDFGKLTRSSNIIKRFWAWDPRMNSTLGAYVLVDGMVGPGYIITPSGSLMNPLPSGSTSQDEHIQSTQAFFVQATSPGTASVTFDENSKSLMNNNSVFRPLATESIDGSLRANLYLANGDTSILSDGVYMQFNNSFSSGIDEYDALKFSNILENLGIISNGKTLMLERRPLVKESDTIFFKLWNTTARNYRFEFITNEFNQQGLEGFLEDTYLNTKTPVNLNGSTVIDFKVTSDAASKATNRFRLVFNPTIVAPLPVTFTSVRAYQQGSDVNVEWKVENEINMKQYEVERSADGTEFTKIATLGSLVNNNSSVNYQSSDKDPVNGVNYYRIRSVSLNGEIRYSNIVKVNMGKDISSITIYPNPISGGIINVHLINQPKGRYMMRLMNKLGQVIITKQIQHEDGTSIEKLQPGKTWAHGTYQLEITSPDKNKTNINVLY